MKQTRFLMRMLISVSIAFIALAGCSNGSSSSSDKKASSWLFMMYLDGDNNLDPDIWKNLNQTEHSLYSIRNTDGTAKDGYASVSVVALWDGDKNGDSVLYELGAEATTNTAISTTTVNLSRTASWMSSGEVNMGSKDTLVNFITWAKSRYAATNVILLMSDHGGGPRSLEDSAKGGKSICEDDTSGNSILYTKDVSTALATAGYSSSNKLNMLFTDACLLGSVESAYQIKDYADYYIASPQSIPGGGWDYEDLMPSFTSIATCVTVGNKIITDYSTQYHNSDAAWKEEITDSQARGSGIVTEDFAKIAYTQTWYMTSTLTFVDLSKMDAVKTAVDDLAAAIIDLEVTYNDYLAYVETTDTIANSMFYDAAAHQYDIGYFAYKVYNDTNSTDAIKAKATAVMTALNNAIISSWRDAHDSIGSGNLYTYINSGSSETPFGLTISTVCEYDKGILAYPYYYNTDLAFGENSAWFTLLKEWYPGTK